MAMATIYSVGVRYSVDGRAAAANTSRLVAGTRQPGNEANRVTSSFRRLGAAVVAAFGVREGAKALIGFNSTVENTKLQIAGMLALVRKTDVVDQVREADKIYANLQQRAKTLPGTTQEYVNMAGKLTRVLVDAGGSTKDLENLTVNAVIAAKGLGEQWEVAARDIEQGLMGRYNTTDPFLSKLLPTIGYSGDEGRDKWRALSKDKRFAEMQRALMQKQITQSAAMQGGTFSGVLSTLQDSMQQTLGKVGLPLFRVITVEIKRWNAWLDNNSAKVDQFAKRFADGLVTGFGMVKDVVGFLVKHADLLITVAKAWAAIKIGGMLFGGAGKAGGGLLGGLSSAAGFMRGPRDRFNPESGGYEFTPAGRGRQGIGGIAGLAGNLPLLGQAFGVGAAIGHWFNETTGASGKLAQGFAELTGRVDGATLRFEQMQRSMTSLDNMIARSKGKEGTIAGTQTVENLVGIKAQKERELDLIGDALRMKAAGDSFGMAQKMAAAEAIGVGRGDFTSAHMAELAGEITRLTGKALELKATGGEAFTSAFLNLTDYQQKTLDVQKAQQDTLQYINQQLSKGLPVDQAHVLDILRKDTQDPSGKGKSMADKPKVNVTIQRIEVASDDPDRFAFGMVEAFRSAAKNPSSALSALREG